MIQYFCTFQNDHCDAAPHRPGPHRVSHCLPYSPRTVEHHHACHHEHRGCQLNMRMLPSQASTLPCIQPVMVERGPYHRPREHSARTDKVKPSHSHSDQAALERRSHTPAGSGGTAAPASEKSLTLLLAGVSPAHQPGHCPMKSMTAAGCPSLVMSNSEGGAPPFGGAVQPAQPQELAWRRASGDRYKSEP